MRIRKDLILNRRHDLQDALHPAQAYPCPCCDEWTASDPWGGNADGRGPLLYVRRNCRACGSTYTDVYSMHLEDGAEANEDAWNYWYVRTEKTE